MYECIFFAILNYSISMRKKPKEALSYPWQP